MKRDIKATSAEESKLGLAQEHDDAHLLAESELRMRKHYDTKDRSILFGILAVAIVVASLVLVATNLLWDLWR